MTDFKGVAQRQSYDGYLYVNAVTDRRGYTTNFTNDPLTGAVTQVQFPAVTSVTPSTAPRGSLTYTYGWAGCPDVNNRDANNPYYLCSVKDEAGNVTRFTRDAQKRVAQINYPDGGSESFTYNNFNQVLTHLMTTGGTEAFTYDPVNGQRLTYRDPYHYPINKTGKPSAWFDYDAQGRLAALTDTLGSALGDGDHTTSYAYNARGQLTTTTLPKDPVDGLRHTIVNAYNLDGTLASTKNQRGKYTSYTYDDYRRVRTVTTPLREAGDTTNRVTNFFYDANQGAVEDYTHTDANVTRLVLPSGRIVKTDYDANGRKKSETAGAETADAATSSYGYDDAGNLTSVVAPDEQPGRPNAGKSTIAAYDERNRLTSVTDPLSSRTSIKYDPAGRKKIVTRANGQTITYDSYDPMNRLLQQTVEQTPSPDAVTKYTYYPSGLLKTMKDPRLVALNSPEDYSYTYDLMGRKESVNYPPAVNGGGGTSESFDYDTAGRPWHFTTRGGNIQTLTYDALHRQKGFTWDDGGITPGVTFGYDIASRLTSIANANAIITRAYFDDNLLASETETVTAGPASTVAYAYDADGNRDSLVYPNNAFSFAYTYSGRNQLKSVRNTAVSSPTATYGYNVNGSLISRALNNSTSSSYGYDALGRVEDISHFLTGETRTFGYDYDSVGRRKWAKRDNALGDVFGYDLNDQVTATKLNITSPATTGAGAPTISYDANGNRNTFAAYGATDTYTTNNLSQYTSRNGVSAIYGPKGNLGSFGAGTNYIYDSQNRLTSATDSGNTFTFKYDGLNRQVSRKLNAGAPVYSVWDGWELLEEVQNGSVTAAYLNGATGLIKDLISNNYYYQDGSGSTSHLADNNGALREWYRYDLQGTPIVYGPANVLRTGGSSYAIRHLFTGQQWIKELGLYDLRNRFYSPDLGRFLQPDPIGFGGDPSNLYRYCAGDPVNRSDPTGLLPGSEPPDWGALPPRAQLFYSGVGNLGIGVIGGFGVAGLGTATFGTGSVVAVTVFGHAAAFTGAKGVSQMFAAVFGTAQQQQGANAMPTNLSSTAALMVPTTVGFGLQNLEAAYSLLTVLSAINNQGLTIGSAFDLGTSLNDAYGLYSNSAQPVNSSNPFGNVQFGLRSFGGGGGVPSLGGETPGLLNGGGLLPFPVYTFYDPASPVIFGWQIDYGGATVAGIFDENGRPVKKLR